jgi:20S proteasome subunit alpha 4
LREFLEKNFKEAMTPKESIKLAVQTLMEVVESAKHIEISVSYPDRRVENLEDAEIERIVKEIEKEKEEAQT